VFSQVTRGTARRLIAPLLATAVALTVSSAPSAHAAPQAGWLPPIGAEIPMSMLARHVPVVVKGHKMHPDFRGGIKVRVDVNPDDPINSVRLRVVGFKMTAEPPDRADVGSITIEQNDVDVDAKSLLRLTQRFPPKYEQIMVLSFTMVIDQPQGRISEPLILTTKDPAKLIGSLTQFPPKGDLYQLQNPVDLVDLENPDTAVATIHKFPVKVGGL
jgi:hypothetical protein